MRDHFGPIKSRLIALNVHDAVTRLVEGGCDVLIAYHHPSQPYQLGADRFDMVSLGQEVLAPYAKADALGQPLPYLAYAEGAYLGQMVELVLKDAPSAIHLDRVYETDMAEGLKAMAIEGHGVAFLPQSAVQHELSTHKLASALPPELGAMHITMEVRAYRERPQLKVTQHTGAAPRRVKGGGRSAARRRCGTTCRNHKSCDWMCCVACVRAQAPRPWYAVIR